MNCNWNVRRGGWALPTWGWFFLGFLGWLMLARLGLPIVAVALLVIFLIPALIRISVQRADRAWDTPADKRKRGPYSGLPADEDAGEKPKRRPVYVVGDDGELVEVFEEWSPKTKRDRDPLDFV